MTMHQTETTAQVVAAFMEYKPPATGAYFTAETVKAFQQRFQKASDRPLTRDEILADPELVEGLIVNRGQTGMALEPDLENAVRGFLRALKSARQDALDEAYLAVNAEGGVGMEPIVGDTLHLAMEAIRRLGGRDPDPKVGEMRKVLLGAAHIFRVYASNDVSSRSQAKVNQTWAEACEEAAR